MPVFSIYGTAFESNLPFRSPLPLSSLSPQLTISETDAPLSLDDAVLLSTTPEEYWNAAGVQSAYERNGAHILLFPGGDQIVVRQNEMLYCHSGNHPRRADLLDVRLLGSGFAWWLLRKGHLPLHAGAVVIEGEAVLFTAESGMGKSSLMTSLISRGVPLLSDDFVAIHHDSDGALLAASAYPQMRLWPVTIEQFIGRSESYDTVFEGGTKRRVPVGAGWGTFLQGTFPVKRIYLLHRDPEPHGVVEATPVWGHEAFMALMVSLLMGSNFPHGELPDVWSVLESVAASVPLYRLSYPSGWDWLPEIQNHVAPLARSNNP